MANLYQSPYQNPYMNNYSQFFPQAPQPQTNQQPQSNGFVSVRSLQEAQNYPVAPGNSVIFKDENAPYIYTKTMGFSQLDRPTFEVFKLVREDLQQEEPQGGMEAIRHEIDQIWSEINQMKERGESDESNEHF